MKLFEVTFRGYKRLYVEADGYDEAERKAIDYMRYDREFNSILDADGSLKKETDSEVTEIRVVSDFVVR